MWLVWGTDICGRDLPVTPPASLSLFFCISLNVQGKDSLIAFIGVMLPLKHCFYNVLFPWSLGFFDFSAVSGEDQTDSCKQKMRFAVQIFGILFSFNVENKYIIEQY